MQTTTITGRFILDPSKTTYIPISTGRGPSSVRIVEIMRVVEVFTDETGMTRTRVEVKG